MEFIDYFSPRKRWVRNTERQVNKLIPIDLRKRFKKVHPRFLQVRCIEMNKENFPSERRFMNLMRHLFNEIVLHRNHPLCNRFFGDFVSLDYSFVIEIDGRSHDGKEDYDKARDEFLTSFGYKVLRLNTNKFNSWMKETELFIASCIGRKPIKLGKISSRQRRLSRAMSKKRFKARPVKKVNFPIGGLLTARTTKPPPQKIDLDELMPA